MVHKLCNEIAIKQIFNSRITALLCRNPFLIVSWSEQNWKLMRRRRLAVFSKDGTRDAFRLIKFTISASWCAWTEHAKRRHWSWQGHLLSSCFPRTEHMFLPFLLTHMGAWLLWQGRVPSLRVRKLAPWRHSHSWLRKWKSCASLLSLYLKKFIMGPDRGRAVLCPFSQCSFGVKNVWISKNLP